MDAYLYNDAFREKYKIRDLVSKLSTAFTLSFNKLKGEGCIDTSPVCTGLYRTVRNL